MRGSLKGREDPRPAVTGCLQRFHQRDQQIEKKPDPRLDLVRSYTISGGFPTICT